MEGAHVRLERPVRFIPSLLVAVILAGCVGSHRSTLPSTSAPEPTGTGTATFVITIPTTSSAPTSGLRAINGVRPQYVSPATQSITIDISGPTDVDETANLTVSSSGCTSSLASTICTLSVPGLQPGDYTATLATYDQTNGTGNVLSAAQSVAFTISAGTSNTVSLILSGVPAKTLVAPANSNSAANGSGGYDLLGQGAHAFIVESLDADGNIIIGPGAPLFTVGTPSGSLSGVTTSPSTTTSSAPNSFTVTPPTSFASGTASFTVAPTFAGQATDGCTQSGANCSALTVTVDMKSVSRVIFLTSGATWTVPTDWNDANNEIEAIGGGGGGEGSGYYDGGGGGGGGGYSMVSNVTLTPGSTVAVQVGTGGAGGLASDTSNGAAGGDTWFCNSTSNCGSITGSAVVVGAYGGSGGGTTGFYIGGAGGTGTTYSGGTGGGGGGFPSGSGGGGGGAAGPNGNGGGGGNGGNGNSAGGGGGGGGNGGGGSGASSSSGLGATGGTSSTNGAGGNGGNSGNSVGAQNGGNGTEFDATHGSGGGGGGGGCCEGFNGGSGGAYGGGGGGAGGGSNSPIAGNGNGGIIVIIYASP